MNNTPRALSLCIKNVVLVATLALTFAQTARAVIVINYQQTGADVTATLSGTIDAAWGAPFLPGEGFVYSGGLNDAFGGFGFSAVRIGYGSALSHDVFYLAGTTSLPAFSLTGTQIGGGVVQSGYDPGVFSVDIYPDSIYLVTPVGVRSVSTSIVWSNKQLSDFFSSGLPVLSDIYSASSEKLATLQIGNAGPGPSPIPEPGTWAAAALLAGGAGFMRWRKRAKVS